MSNLIEQLVDSINSNSSANFVDRLKRYPNINKIYYNPWDFSTHKLSWSTIDNGKAIVYPQILEIDGNLVDFSTYGHDKNDALKSAKEHNDYIIVPEELADEFTQTYKLYYPGFPEYLSKKPGGKINYLNLFK